MEKVLRRIVTKGLNPRELGQVLRREWLATNGLGGYASATIGGAVNWRYHGLFIPSLPAPLGRVVMLNHLVEAIHTEQKTLVQFGDDDLLRHEEAGESGKYLQEFRLENGLPVWLFDIDGIRVEKHLLFLHRHNTVHIHYRLLSPSGPVRLRLRPSINFRHHEHPVSDGSNQEYRLRIHGGQYEIRGNAIYPSLRLTVLGSNMHFTHDGGSRRELVYQKEADRGYSSLACLWSPGYFEIDLQPGHDATLIASTEPWHIALALTPEEALDFYHERRRSLLRLCGSAPATPASDLVLAADQFIIIPASRILDAARAHAAGDDIRTVIAGYHWFTDWGRDTMISLEGLTLCTGRFQEAAWILRTFAHYIRDGLIPNMFPDGQNKGLYHTADATLWFFHALDRYVEASGDRLTLRSILPKLEEVTRLHVQGTRFGIHVDPADGLLFQGASGYQLTWMDAKVDDWVVTPRRGKAVEINALWYNALRLLESWLAEEGKANEAREYAKHADRVLTAFTSRFWCAEKNYLYDVIDGEHGADNACRPNQLLAFSLKHPVLDSQYWPAVLNVVRDQLLTPVGLRSLSPDHPDYKSKYFGDLRARDAAYHQGTVWAWLIGPFIDAWLRVHPDDRAGARRFLQGFVAQLDEGCVGSINEIFDADPPFTPRGCIAQAWSVAEVLRAWLKTEP